MSVFSPPLKLWKLNSTMWWEPCFQFLPLHFWAFELVLPCSTHTCNSSTLVSPLNPQQKIGAAFQMCWIWIKNTHFPLLGYFYYIFKNILFIYFQREGRKKEKERNISVWVDSHMSPPGDLAHNSGVCLDSEWNQWPSGSQAGTWSTEPHQPGLFLFLITVTIVLIWVFIQIQVILSILLSFSDSLLMDLLEHRPDADTNPVSTVLWMRWDKFTRTTEILWKKRDDMATLSVKERACPVPCLDRLLLGLICIGIQGIYIKLINHCQAEMIKQ